MNAKEVVKHTVQRTLHAVGLHVSRYRGPLLVPVCPGYLPDVLGHRMYQSASDLGLDYSRFIGRSPKELRLLDPEVDFISRNVRPGSHCVDIGANVGFFTLLIAKAIGPDGQLFSFEPGPLSFGLLQANVRLNDYGNVHLENKAVAEASSLANLYINPRGESDNHASIAPIDYGADQRERLAIQAVSLDDYFDGKQSRIDYIKMDIQGAEYRALNGMRRVLTENARIQLTVEYAPYLPLWSDVTPRDYVNLIRSFGFKMFDLASVASTEVDLEYLTDTYGIDKPGKFTTLLLKR